MPSPAKIDWREALGYYIALGPTRTFVKVARRYGVSDVAVGKRARAESWDDVCRPVDERRRAEALEEVQAKLSRRLEGAIAGFG